MGSQRVGHDLATEQRQQGTQYLFQVDAVEASFVALQVSDQTLLLREGFSDPSI